MRKYMNSTLGRRNIFKNARFKMPMMLDADPGMGGGSAPGGSSEEGGTPEPEEGADGNDNDEDIELIKQELAKAKAENLRFKNSINKLTEEKAKITKKNREMMSADQIAQEEREERDRQFVEMQKELRTNRYSKKLVGLGMAEEDADTFASTLPEMEDPDSFFSTLASFISAREKSASEKAIQELLKNRPDIHAGNGDTDKDDLAMQFAKKSVENSKKTFSGEGKNIINQYL